MSDGKPAEGRESADPIREAVRQLRRLPGVGEKSATRLVYFLLRTPGAAQEIAKALAGIASQAQPDDLVFVTLIGFGTYQGGEAKFNLPGPDMTPVEFDAQLKKLPTKQIVFVNTASASGPFVERLSGVHFLELRERVPLGADVYAI